MEHYKKQKAKGEYFTVFSIRIPKELFKWIRDNRLDGREILIDACKELGWKE